MACKIIYNGQKYTDEEFKKYLIDNGITEDQLVKEKDVLDRVTPLIPSINGAYKQSFEINAKDALYSIAQQINTSAAEKRGAIKAVGQKIVDLAEELFPDAKYLQLDTDLPKPASPATLAKIKEFNDRIGVKTESVSSIVIGGKKMNASGLAAPYKGLIQIVNGKEDVALPEESMHIATEILQQTNQPLFQAMLKDVNKHPEMQQVYNTYGKNPLYQTPEGKPDVIKLKKEAIAKVLAKVVGQVVDSQTDPQVAANTRSLWQRIVDFFKKLFSKAGFDPFETAAKKIVNDEEIGKVKDLSKKPLYSNISLTDRYRTANVGNHEGQQEFNLNHGEVDKSPEYQTDMKKEQVANIKKWDVPLDEGTENPHGETMGQFVGRVITRYQQDKATQPHNTAIMAHSSVLKTIKTYEKLKNLPEFTKDQPVDWNHLSPEQAKMFADSYISESTKNGDVEKYSSANGDFYVARHGQTEDNFTGRFRSAETPLTPLGIEQGVDVGRKLDRLTRGKGIGNMLSSDYGRAIHTANLAMNEIQAKDDYYLQISEDHTFDKINKIHTQVAKAGSEYSVNGIPVKYSVDKDIQTDLSKKFKDESDYKKALNEFKNESEGKIQIQMSEIGKRYIGDDGYLRQEVSTTPVVNIIDPKNYDRTFIDTLDKWFVEKLDSYPEETRFLMGKNIYNSVQDKAGSANFIALMPDGKVDINQFKLITPSKYEKDINPKLQGTYNVEIQGLRDILSKAYSIKADDFRETRVIPIKAIHSQDEDTGKFSLDQVKIGNANVELEKDPLLQPIPSYSETTGDKELDKLISRTRALADQLSKQKPVKGEEHDKIKKMAELYSAIRQLQVKKNAKAFLKSAKAIAESEDKRFPTLKKKVESTDPLAAGQVGVGELSRAVAQSRDRLTPLVDLHASMKKIYKNSDPDGFIKSSKEITDSARDTTENLDELENFIRTQKYSKITGIADALKPERSIGNGRKFLLGVSHGNFKSAGQMWHLAEYKNNLYHKRFGEDIKQLQHFKDSLKKLNISDEDLQKKLFERDSKGRWTGNLIQKIDKSFYQTVKSYLAKKDIKSLRQAIDLDAYRKLYTEKLADYEEYLADAQYGETEEESNKAKAQLIAKFKADNDIDKPTAATPANIFAYRFPKEGSWDSSAYNDLKKPGNEEVMSLYNYWLKTVDRAASAGMFEDSYSDKYGFFPHIKKSWLEKATTKDGLKGGIFDPWSAIATIPDDEKVGEFNAITGEPINRIHGQYMRDLGRRVADTDGKYYNDYAEVSQNVLKSMYSFIEDLTRFELRKDIEDNARMILNTEGRIPSLKGTKTKTGELQLVPNKANVDMIHQMVDYYVYDKTTKESGDLTFNVNIGGKMKAINKFFGFKFFKEPKNDVVTISGKKTLDQLFKYYYTKVQAVNAVGATAWVVGGGANAAMNAGDYYDKMDLARASARIASTHDWGTPEGQIRAGLLDYFQPLLISHEKAHGRTFSSSKAVRYLNTDNLFFMMRLADKAVTNTVAIAYIDNAIIRDGKLQNIVQMVRSDNNWNDRYSLPREEREALEKKVDTEVDRLKKESPDLLTKLTKVDKDGNVTIPDIPDSQYVEFRQKLSRLVQETMGNFGSDDVALYRRDYMFKKFMMFKGWMGELVHKRVGPLEYDYGAHKYTYGRGAALVGNLRDYGLHSIGALFESLGGSKESFIHMANEQYEKRKQQAADKGEEFNISRGEFNDLYVKGIIKQFKELGLAIGVLGMYFALLAASRDKGETHGEKGLYSFTLRAIDRFQDQISFFYNPSSFTSMFSGAILPPVGLLTDIEKLLKGSVIYGYDKVTGNDAAASKSHLTKTVMRDIPVLKEWVTYEAMLSEQFAKENGISLQTTASGGH